MYLILAFPSGQLPGRVDRLPAGAMAFVIVVLFVPRALLVETYPVPAPATSCVSDCPHNAFMLVSAEPAFVEDIVRPLRELLVAALFAAATVRDDPARAKILRALATDVDTAIDEVRSLACGIYPGVLADRGLVVA